MSLRTRISRRVEWDMGHRLMNHESLCRNLHGHRYVAEIVVEGPVIEDERSPERGMVQDFGVLKEFLNFIPRKFDHAFMVQKDDPLAAYLAQFEKHLFDSREPLRILEVPFSPTAENIAAEILRRVASQVGSRIRIIEVTVWETPNCKATVIA